MYVLISFVSFQNFIILTVFIYLFICLPAHIPSNMAANIVTGVQVNTSSMETETPRAYQDSPVPSTQPTPAQRSSEEQIALPRRDLPRGLSKIIPGQAWTPRSSVPWV